MTVQTEPNHHLARTVLRATPGNADMAAPYLSRTREEHELMAAIYDRPGSYGVAWTIRALLHEIDQLRPR